MAYKLSNNWQDISSQVKAPQTRGQKLTNTMSGTGSGDSLSSDEMFRNTFSTLDNWVSEGKDINSLKSSVLDRAKGYGLLDDGSGSSSVDTSKFINTPRESTQEQYNQWANGQGQPLIANQMANVPQQTTPSFALTGGNLNVGSNGQDVSNLQKLLGVATDGKYGPLTQKAVMDFQTKNGLKADGIVGPLTAAALAKQGQTLTQGQQFTDPAGRTGTVGFDSNTGQPLAQGGTTPAIGGQMAAIPQPGSTAPQGGVDQSSLEQQYKALIGSSPEEQSAQKAIDDQNNAARTGMQNVAEQPIGMSFISGQQASLENRNTNLQIPLQQQLANAQQKRQASLDAIKFQLDRSDKATDRGDKLASEAKDEAYRRDALSETKRNNTLDASNKNSGTTSSGIKYTPTQTQALKQAGVNPKDENAQTFFLNTDKAFQDYWARAVGSSPSNQTYSVQELMKYYDTWVNNVKNKKEDDDSPY